MLISFLNILKRILTNLKIPLFILIILKETIYIKIIIKIILIKTIIEINKDKAKYIITACINWHVYPNYYKIFFSFYEKKFTII